MLKLGLTGNIGSGKSTVASMLSDLGAAVIDADVLARQATSDPQVLERLRELFGPGIVRDGALDRPALAAIVFGDEEQLGRLNAVVHPWVRHEAGWLQDRYLAEGRRVVVQDVPLLFENGLQDGFDAVLVVSAPAPLRMERVQRRSGLSDEEFRKRDSAQWELERKEDLADFVLHNTGTEQELRRQVEKVWRELVNEPPPG